MALITMIKHGGGQAMAAIATFAVPVALAAYPYHRRKSWAVSCTDDRHCATEKSKLG